MEGYDIYKAIQTKLKRAEESRRIFKDENLAQYYLDEIERIKRKEEISRRIFY
jgi:hypothetical protein